ncbi:MAG: hypothetical protein Pg6C_19480 [Treponemataceae bacterium]|nr:MAG: hypothetical protein Pg6C_19480 [Treponemataceae bacterium]
MCQKDIKNIRKNSFSKKFVLDANLVHCLDSHDRRFDFLRNPVVQNIYNYQIEYILDFLAAWSQTSFPKLLDWGCGKGYVSYLLKNKNIPVISCDVSDTAGSSAFLTNSPIFGIGKINVVELKHEYILPFNDGSFDAVLSFGVLEHVPNDLESLKEIRRILKTKGLFFCFYLPYKLSYTQNIQRLRKKSSHKVLYWKKDVKKLLSASGLQLLDIWHRAFLPKISFIPPFYHAVEKADNWICNNSILKYFATNIEFVAYKD